MCAAPLAGPQLASHGFLTRLPPARPPTRPPGQGSNDGATWADLRRHIGNRTIRMPGQYASWPVSSHAAAVPYRLFRLLLVGPNLEAPNAYHM